MEGLIDIHFYFPFRKDNFLISLNYFWGILYATIYRYHYFSLVIIVSLAYVQVNIFSNLVFLR